MLYAGGLKEAMARAQAGEAWLVETVGDDERAVRILETQPFAGSVTLADGRIRVTLLPERPDPHAIPEALVREGVKIRLFKPAETTLEEAFLKLTKGDVA